MGSPVEGDRLFRINENFVLKFSTVVNAILILHRLILKIYIYILNRTSVISKGRIEEIGEKKKKKKSRARDLQYLGGYCAWRSLKSRFLNASSSLSIISLSVSLCFALKTFVVEGTGPDKRNKIWFDVVNRRFFR